MTIIYMKIVNPTSYKKTNSSCFFIQNKYYPNERRMNNPLHGWPHLLLKLKDIFIHFIYFFVKTLMSQMLCSVFSLEDTAKQTTQDTEQVESESITTSITTLDTIQTEAKSVSISMILYQRQSFHLKLYRYSLSTMLSMLVILFIIQYFSGIMWTLS